MRNVPGRELPNFIDGIGDLRPYGSPSMARGGGSKSASDGNPKRLADIRGALAACDVRDGATLSFHHHLRNGDHVMNLVLTEAARMGLRDLRIAPSSIFPVHEPLVALIEAGVIRSIHTAYVSGPVADAIGRGSLCVPAVLQTHGGRARAIESGELAIDVAFIAAPASDDRGNINGVSGPNACGTLGYAMVDARHAKRVVAVTDHLVKYPACPIDIAQDCVDFVVTVESIGDAARIVSGTTRITEDPVGLDIAKSAARVIEAAGLLDDGFSFQTGAGGVSLAVARFVEDGMRRRRVKGSFASGGITGQIVGMLEAGLFDALFDVQCFDLRAVESYRRNHRHQAMSASMYASPSTRGSVSESLDAMILGAAQVDLDFNVNVTTTADGRIIGGSGGHSDTAAGARLAIVTTRLRAGVNPKIVESVRTITTPGASVDVVVTEAGIAVNPARDDLADMLKSAGIDTVSIARLHDLAIEASGEDRRPTRAIDDAPVIALQQYRDGSIIDIVRRTY
ncbi:citrate lyase subunit alpha [Caballeronia sp. J97]|uniref:citrate lyase subunit alpha n=1 Tax=Caballeronia sp. J97 TaxID=2805429 RepID=UPI002AAF690B|nr:citrate lyase subunit alpha [Caballeronia sp. J97]